MDITFDMFPYPFGPTKLLIMFPEWVQDGGPRRVVEVLKDGEARERLRDEVVPRARGWDEMWMTNFKLSEHKEYEGKSIAAVAEARGQHPVDMMSDLLLEENLGVSYFAESVDKDTLPDFMAHPLYMVGSDAVMIGDFPAPMAYGCYPMFLSKMVREEGRLRLEEAIRKMTSGPAQRLGIPDRGILRDGLYADLVVFDADTIKPNVSRSNPKALSDGVEYVIVNGTVVIDQGRHTGALPGRALRK
jgi:N-acyl-D-amino-acid deacylase